MKQILIASALLMISTGACKATVPDSTITPSSGIARITTTSDTTADTLRLSRFIEINDVPIMDMPTPANILTLSPEEGDWISYLVVRYSLLDYRGNVLYSNRYNISGSCYEALKLKGAGYAYWKICHAKGFTPK